MKRLFAKSEKKPLPEMKIKRLAFFSLPREVWMVDIKKASDYSGQLPKKHLGEND